MHISSDGQIRQRLALLPACPPSGRVSLMLLDRGKIPEIVEQVNHYLRGERHDQLAGIIPSSDGFAQECLASLQSNKRPPRTDGKSLGTCIEKLLKAEISRQLGAALTGSAAAGVDIPELSLNTKATSDKQPQSSEPFDSPYERVLGAKYHILACVYNGRDFLAGKDTPIQITAAMYYEPTEIADMELCATARLLRDLYSAGSVEESLAQRGLRAIVYAKKRSTGHGILRRGLQRNELQVIAAAIEEYEETMAAKGKIELPKPEEWSKFKTSPLNGKIGISFALQWRYQYKPNVKGVRYF